MYTSRTRDRRLDKPKKSKKDKKLSNLINNSDSDTGNESEHELSYYMDDRVKLMKEVLKIIKPKKIKAMAPDCMKRMQVEEINSMLLEESLGISTKRLKYIFEGKNLDDENSSTDEDQPVDVISLDDISEDDFVLISDDETDKHTKKHKRKRVKEEPKDKSRKVKKEKPEKEKGKEKIKEKGKEKEKTSRDKEPMGEENLMSVLELLELQARARAIRSQLDLESKRKKEEQEILERKQAERARENEQDDDEEIIIEIPKEVEIIIASSDSENEEVKKKPDKSKASTSKENTPISNANSASVNNITENTNDSSIQTNDNSAKDNNNKTNNEKSENKDKNGKQKTSESINNIRNIDKEEGELSDGETVEKEKSDERMELSAIPVPPEGRPKSDEIMAKNTSKESSSDTSNSGSDSSDNLQVVMLREKKKRKRACISTAENVESVDRPLESAEKGKTHNNDSADDDNARNMDGNESMDQVITKKQSEESTDKAIVNEKNSGSEPQNDSRDTGKNDTSQSQGKLDNVIADFLKTQPPPPPDKTEEFNALDEVKKNEEKANLKEKRLKHLKNKLQSYKKDVEGESSVTILENIVIKPKDVIPGAVTEDSDDLVINVDQDDLDCIIVLDALNN